MYLDIFKFLRKLLFFADKKYPKYTYEYIDPEDGVGVSRRYRCDEIGNKQM